MPYYEDVKEMPLGDALERHTGVPVYIQHDISADDGRGALAPHAARATLSVVIDHNVGAGVITDGHLLHAGSSSLVEIGHTVSILMVSAVIAVIMAVWRPSPASIACWNLRSFGLISR